MKEYKVTEEVAENRSVCTHEEGRSITTRMRLVGEKGETKSCLITMKCPVGSPLVTSLVCVCYFKYAIRARSTVV